MNEETLGYDPNPDVRSWHGTPIPPVDDPVIATDTLRAIAERIWWNGPPWTVLRNSVRFIQHAIGHATDDDIGLVKTKCE